MVASLIGKNALQILEERYLLRDAKGKLIETAEELFSRVAGCIAKAENHDRERWEALFLGVLSRLEFLPNSPTLMNAGLPKGQLSACFVLPVNDSLNAIFTSLKKAALIHQSGGGTGFNFSKLRSSGTPVSLGKGTSSGPVAFMKIFDAATEYVKQGGKRRGANMGILNIDHPDIEAFISAKRDRKSLNNFNLSIGVSESFMNAVENNLSWSLKDPSSGTVTKKVSAKKLWNSIAETAWETGDPGLVFFDSINRFNPTPSLGNIECTNPCGEVPLLDYESCNLGSVNLSKMVIRDGNNFKIDYDKLAQTVALGIRFLDNAISVNHYLFAPIKSMAFKNRKIGLGLMGWADLLMLLDIPYASDKAVELAEKLMSFVKAESYKASTALASERGCFLSWEESNFYPQSKMRNATCNSIAPTGTISVIANTSYSIEPLYALAYNRVGILENTSQQEVSQIFEMKMKQKGYWNAQLKSKVLKSGTIKDVPYIPEEVKKVFETSLEIPYKYHLLHQKAFQKFTDNAVSKTINLPANATPNNVSDIYFSAWKYGLKGITIYRDGSNKKQVLQKCNTGASLIC